MEVLELIILPAGAKSISLPPAPPKAPWEREKEIPKSHEGHSRVVWETILGMQEEENIGLLSWKNFSIPIKNGLSLQSIQSLSKTLSPQLPINQESVGGLCFPIPHIRLFPLSIFWLLVPAYVRSIVKTLLASESSSTGRQLASLGFLPMIAGWRC